MENLVVRKNSQLLISLFFSGYISVCWDVVGLFLPLEGRS